MGVEVLAGLGFILEGESNGMVVDFPVVGGKIGGKVFPVDLKCRWRLQ